MRQMLIIMALTVVGCKSNSQLKTSEHITTGAPALVYKTKSNYNNLVPIILSADKSQIVSYPHPSDVVVNGKFSTPTQLANGYLLDNRGIGKSVAFTKYTYEEYSKMSIAPTLDDLYKSIVDKDPITDMCQCGNRSQFKDIEKELNKIISEDRILKSCKKQ